MILLAKRRNSARPLDDHEARKRYSPLYVSESRNISLYMKELPSWLTTSSLSWLIRSDWSCPRATVLFGRGEELLMDQEEYLLLDHSCLVVIKCIVNVMCTGYIVHRVDIVWKAYRVHIPCNVLDACNVYMACNVSNGSIAYVVHKACELPMQAIYIRYHLYATMCNHL